MLTKKEDKLNDLTFITLEELVPDDHLVRKLAQIDYDFIYDEVKAYYSKDGRPSIDPVILFKILLLKDIYHYRSIQQTLKEIEVNLAFRWFLNLSLREKLPHYSVISNNFNYRYNKNTLNKIFKQIINAAIALNIGLENKINLKKLKYKVKKTTTNKNVIVVDEKTLYDKTLV